LVAAAPDHGQFLTPGRYPTVLVVTATVLRPIDPSAITIDGCRPLARTLRRDPRGFLVETLRRDDSAVAGDRFAMSYTSITLPGHFRDADRWHVHRVQTDRFVVTMGTMVLALLDGRADSPTNGRLEVVALAGADPERLAAAEPTASTIHLVPIPPGVYHCIGNVGVHPFVLQNFPTELYDPGDEGRVPFTEAPIASLGGPFGWPLVERGATDRRGR